MTGVVLLLAFVTLQRLGELVLARRNTRDLLARGGLEIAPGHYPMVVALHALWLAALWAAAPASHLVWGWVALYAVLQAARAWVLASLGRRWTTRIIVVPGETLVRRGPYRFVSHPNYWVVAGEIAVLPLALGQPLTALVFSFANALVLAVRIRAENAALAPAAGRATGRA